MNNDRVVYDIQYGCVVDTVAKNWELGINGGRRCVQNNSQENKLFTRGTWLIIDEFNRADIDK